jgi:hypothetical protein
MYTKAQLKAAQEAQKQAERSRLPWPVETPAADRVKSNA